MEGIITRTANSSLKPFASKPLANSSFQLSLHVKLWHFVNLTVHTHNNHFQSSFISLKLCVPMEVAWLQTNTVLIFWVLIALDATVSLNWASPFGLSSILYWPLHSFYFLLLSQSMLVVTKNFFINLIWCTVVSRRPNPI